MYISTTILFIQQTVSYKWYYLHIKDITLQQTESLLQVKVSTYQGYYSSGKSPL